MQDFTNTRPDRTAERDTADLDNALLYAALAHAGEPQTETPAGQSYPGGSTASSTPRRSA